MFRRALYLSFSVQTFKAKIRHTTDRPSNHKHFFCIPLIRKKYHSDIFFSRTSTLRNTLPRECLFDHNTLNIVESRVNCYQLWRTALSNPRAWVTPVRYIGWKAVKKKIKEMKRLSYSKSSGFDQRHHTRERTSVLIFKNHLRSNKPKGTIPRILKHTLSCRVTQVKVKYLKLGLRMIWWSLSQFWSFFIFPAPFIIIFLAKDCIRQVCKTP